MNRVNKNDRDIIFDRIGRGESFTSIAKTLGVSPSQVSYFVKDTCNETVDSIRKIAVKKIKKDIKNNGIDTVPTYIKDNNIKICRTTFGKYVGLSRNDIYTFRRQYKRQSLKDRYTKIKNSYSGTLTTTTLQKLDPTLSSLIYYHYGSIYNFKLSL